MDKLKIEFENDIPIVISGKLLDNEFKNDVNSFLDTYSNDSNYIVILDLGAAEIMYSYGVSAIQNLCDYAEEAKGTLALCNVSNIEIREVLEISALLDRCQPHVYKDRSSAMAAFTQK